MNKATINYPENKDFLLSAEAIDSEIKQYAAADDVGKDHSIEWLNSVHMMAETIAELSKLFIISKAHPERVSGDKARISGQMETLRYLANRLNSEGQQINRIYKAEEIQSDLKNKLIEQLLLRENKK